MSKKSMTLGDFADVRQSLQAGDFSLLSEHHFSPNPIARSSSASLKPN